MAKTTGRLFLPLDVEFMDDDKIVDAGEKAGWMYLAMCLRSKRLMSDGLLTFGQVSRLHVTAQAPRLAALLEHGLIEQTETGYLVSAFPKRNPLAAAITEKADRKAAGAALGNHNRWHVARGVTDSQCDHCTDKEANRTTDTQAIGTESVSESTETETETETETLPTDSVAALPDCFSDFWSIYPRRIAKGAALKAWKAATKKTDPAVILAAATVFAESVRGTDPKFTPHPSTWLNAERWADERPQLRAVNGPAWKMGDWDV